jgi:uncharacterized protein (DUF1501 family)
MTNRLNTRAKTHSKTLSRRKLLLGSTALSWAAVGGVASLPFASSPLRAQGAGRKLVIVLASGGWDPTYALDPKVGSSVVDAPGGTVTEISGIPLLSDPTRPSVDAFFTRFGSLTAVINGVQVRSFVHADCMKRMLTGTASDQNADFGALVANEAGRELPVPYLVLGTSAMSGPLASITGRAGTTNQLSSLLVPSAADPFLPAPGLSPTDAEYTAIDEYLSAATAREQAVRGQIGSNARALEAFQASLDRAGLLRQFAAQNGSFGERGYTPDLMVQVDVGVRALTGDLCHSTMLELGNWDTHQDNAQQGPMHEALFAALIHLGDSLEQAALLDRTTVVVLSEMGRTPKLNSAMGKDHWPVTSCMVFGAGVRGGQVFGATDDSQNAANVTFATGVVGGEGKQIQASNLAATVLQLAGLDSESHFPGVEPLGAVIA